MSNILPKLFLQKNHRKLRRNQLVMIYLPQKLKLFCLGRTNCLDLPWAIPKGFCGRIFPRSSLIREKNVTVEAGLIDSDNRNLIYVLLFNHSDRTFTVRTGERLAQVVFLEKFDVRFDKVNKKEDLGSTKRGSGGFGSKGITVIKKMKTHEDELDSQDDLEITAKEGNYYYE